jgi:pimeloyl-ACP methyl ester carboxylesterase
VPRIDVRGLITNVQRLPAAGQATDTVVFVHGILTDSLASYYFTLGPAFAAAGFDVLMYDLRGHGRSARPTAGYQLDRFVADLAGLLDELGIRRPVHLVGNSFGGTVAYGYAVAHPHRVRSLAMIEGEPATSAWAAKMAANLRRATEQLVLAEALEWITQRYNAHTARLARGAATLLHTTTLGTDIPDSQVLTEPEVAALDCPVLAIYGQHSDLAAQAPWLSGLLARCRTVVVPDQEHSVLIERPELTRELTMAWVREHAGELAEAVDR